MHIARFEHKTLFMKHIFSFLFACGILLLSSCGGYDKSDFRVAKAGVISRVPTAKGKAATVLYYEVDNRTGLPVLREDTANIIDNVTMYLTHAKITLAVGDSVVIHRDRDKQTKTFDIIGVKAGKYSTAYFDKYMKYLQADTLKKK